MQKCIANCDAIPGKLFPEGYMPDLSITPWVGHRGFTLYPHLKTTLENKFKINRSDEIRKTQWWLE